MAKTKVTFTLDDATIARLAKAAQRLDKPKSQVVREAIREYSDRIGKLSEQERLRVLTVFDEVVPRIPRRPKREVSAELLALRTARRQGGRASPPEPDPGIPNPGMPNPGKPNPGKPEAP